MRGPTLESVFVQRYSLQGAGFDVGVLSVSSVRKERECAQDREASAAACLGEGLGRREPLCCCTSV